MRVLLSALAILFLSQAAAQPAQERRVALVIGVTDYDAVANLANPRNGARQIYEALRATGFEVDEPLDSPTKAQLDAALLAFSRRADTADVALLYYAGHGMQQFDDNWLIPKDARLERPQDVRVEAARLQDIVGLMSNARLRIIILDACRNNPFSARWPSTMSPSIGLTDVAVPVGTVVAYSAGPRQEAPDNNVFARALAENIQMEGLTLRQVLERTRDAVVDASPRLNPTITYDSNTAQFYFRGSGPTEREVVRPRFGSLPPGHYRIDFSAGSNANAPRYVIAAEPFLRRGPVAVTVQSRVPSDSVIVFQNNAGAYAGRALTPTTGSDNFLTQVDTGNQAASFTLRFSRPLSSVSFVVPALYAATGSGVTFPAWSATALDARGEVLDRREDGLRGSWEDVNAQRHTLSAPSTSSGIVALQFASDPRVNGEPFAAFSAIMIEELIVEPRQE